MLHLMKRFSGTRHKQRASEIRVSHPGGVHAQIAFRDEAFRNE